MVKRNVFNLLPGLSISVLKNNRACQQYSVIVLFLSGGIFFGFVFIFLGWLVFHIFLVGWLGWFGFAFVFLLA